MGDIRAQRLHLRRERLLIVRGNAGVQAGPWLKILGNPRAQYADHIFPLSVVGAGAWDLPNWVQGYERFWKEKAAEGKAAGDNEKEEAATRHALNARAFGDYLIPRT